MFNYQMLSVGNPLAEVKGLDPQSLYYTMLGEGQDQVRGLGITMGLLQRIAWGGLEELAPSAFQTARELNVELEGIYNMTESYLGDKGPSAKKAYDVSLLEGAPPRGPFPADAPPPPSQAACEYLKKTADVKGQWQDQMSCGQGEQYSRAERTCKKCGKGKYNDNPESPACLFVPRGYMPVNNDMYGAKSIVQ